MNQTGNPTQTWNIDLSQPPRNVKIGIGVHGHSLHESWRLPVLWCLHLYRYHATITIDGVAHKLSPGCVSVIPPNTEMVYDYQGLSTHVYCHFECPDNGQCGSSRTLNAVQNIGAKFGGYNDRLILAMPDGANANLAHAEAALWSILWDLSANYNTQIAHDSHPELHPVVRNAAHIVELDMALPLTVPEIAIRCNVSQSYLTQLFHRHLGCTVVAYIRQRRMARARSLLEESTLPIRAIAETVGISDLHLFNKTVRRELGLSPRGVRKLATRD